MTLMAMLISYYDIWIKELLIYVSIEQMYEMFFKCLIYSSIHYIFLRTLRIQILGEIMMSKK